VLWAAAYTVQRPLWTRKRRARWRFQTTGSLAAPPLVAQALDAIAADPFGDAAAFVPSLHRLRPQRARGFRRLYGGTARVAPTATDAGSGAAGAPAPGASCAAAAAAGAAAATRASLEVLECICQDIQVPW
jgi:hypothetical protein